MSWRPDCIFEIHQLWQSDFSRVYSNSCCSCSFEPEIIKTGRSSHKMYSKNILNFEYLYKKVCGNLLKAPRIYHFFVWSNFNLLYNSYWITIPTQSCLVFLLYYFAAFAYYVINCSFIIIIIIIWDFFIPVLADGFPLEFEWQQIFSSLQESS